MLAQDVGRRERVVGPKGRVLDEGRHRIEGGRDREDGRQLLVLDPDEASRLLGITLRVSVQVRWLLGATLVGAMLLAFGALNFWFATLPALAGGGVVLLTLVIFLLAALGMQLMTFEDMTYELRRTNRRLESAQSDLRQLVITDALTGMRNRRFFDEVIDRELQRHRRYKSPLSIVFIDIDRFKKINDTLGHETGDRVLREVASFLLRHIREADYVFRWGGDEFLVLISCGEEEAIRRGVTLQEAFAASPQLASLPPGVALSIGCVEVPPETDDIMPLVQAADERMYVDKNRRR